MKNSIVGVGRCFTMTTSCLWELPRSNLSQETWKPWARTSAAPSCFFWYRRSSKRLSLGRPNSGSLSEDGQELIRRFNSAPLISALLRPYLGVRPSGHKSSHKSERPVGPAEGYDDGSLRRIFLGQQRGRATVSELGLSLPSTTFPESKATTTMCQGCMGL